MTKSKSKASASGSGKLSTINERYTIGGSAPLLYNDLSNDTFLIKQHTPEQVV